MAEISVIDYGMGNLHSVKNALEHIGVKNKIITTAEEILAAESLILPGVGAFPDAARVLKEKGLEAAIIEKAKTAPLLGICLGMQLLFEKSSEYGETEGLGLLDGEVVMINAPGLKIPHMGWNSLDCTRTDPLTDRLGGSSVYFVHSYRAETADKNVVAYCEYGEKIPAIVRKPGKNVYGMQFHPEKSHNVGLELLRRFSAL